MTFHADLHCHTTCSDGSCTPEEIIALAVERGLQGLSITDHDSIAAYPIAVPLASEKGLFLGTGVEFSCVHKEISVHVLGYGFDSMNEGIEALCKRHQNRRIERNRAILANLRKHKIDIDESELPQIGTIGRPHIAKVLLEKGVVKTFQEAFHSYLSEGKSCYVQGEPISVQETIDILHRAKAKAFLAHPHLLHRSTFVRKLFELPFDGIECYYAKSPPGDEERWVRFAQERGLLISGGSDFHGSFKPYISLGSRWVDEATFHKIFPNV